MIKVYIINLERSKDRRADIVSRLRQYDISFEIFNAVDGKQMSEEMLRKIHLQGKPFKKMYGTDMQRGEAGAAMSHLNLYKKIIADKPDWAIIMEDDAAFDQRLKHLIDSKSKFDKVLKTYDLILLGYCRNDLDYRKNAVCSYWNRFTIDKDLRVGQPVYWYWSAIGYIITLQGATKFIEYNEYPVMQADFLTANSPFYGVRLGIFREPIVWASLLSEVSTIRNVNEKLVNNAGAEMGKRNKHGLRNIQSSLKTIFFAEPGLNLQTRLKRLYKSVRDKLDVLKLKLSKNYKFLIQIENN